MYFSVVLGADCLVNVVCGILFVQNTPFHPSMFGTSLEEVMELQKKIVPESQKLPWVVQALVKAVVELEGPSTEGIFR